MFRDATKPDFDWRAAYKLLLGIVNPRPIALVSTISADGTPNLAPFSFYNLCSAHPPVLMVCPALDRSRRPKHTYENIAATREFVVATVTEHIAPQMVRSAAELPSGENEFAFAGLTSAPASLVRPGLVREAHANIECRLRQIVAMGDGPGAGQVVFGDIVAIHIDDQVLKPAGDAVDPDRLRTVGRLAEQYYCTVTETYEMDVPPAK